MMDTKDFYPSRCFLSGIIGEYVGAIHCDGYRHVGLIKKGESETVKFKARVIPGRRG